MDDGPRRVAHRRAETETVRYFTGQPGIAASRIVFVNDATGKKEVCAVDADGENFQRLTNDRSIALFELSPDGEWIIFTSFRGGRPSIDRMRSDGRDRATLCRFEGLNSAAAWMPDGNSIVATLSDGRSPNLYQVDLEGRVILTLTNSSGGRYRAHGLPGRAPPGVHLGPPRNTSDLSHRRHRRHFSGGRSPGLWRIRPTGPRWGI